LLTRLESNLGNAEHRAQLGIVNLHRPRRGRRAGAGCGKAAERAV
jgi:hypothetical protein